MRLAPLLVLLLTASTLRLADVASAQAPPPVSAAPGLTDSARVSLLTMLPGDEVYSLFGHSAFRITDPAAGLDRTYNFGTFDFEQPYFVLRFLRGELDYRLDTAPFWVEWEKYQFLERPIIEQTLDLPPDAVRALYARLEVNALPEYRDYRYDFFWDNCSTRLLVAIDSVLVDVGAPTLDLPPTRSPRTFRQLLDPYWEAMPAVGFAANLALGAPADRIATAREETFLPIELAAQLDRATLDGRPLVARRDTLFWVPGAGIPEEAPDVPLWTAWALLAVGAVGTAWGGWRTRSRAGRWADALLLGVVGFAGLVFLLLWVGTEHRVTGPNWNLLWAWPTHLAAAWAIGRRSIGRRWQVYFLATAFVCGVTAVLWAVVPQALPAAALPLVLLLALRAAVRSRRPEDT